MATKTRSNNTDEITRLEAEIKELKGQLASALEKARIATDTVSAKNNEIKSLQESLAAAYEKIQRIEDLEKPAEKMTRGFVEIATLPFKGMLPLPSKVDGVQVPRKVDSDGVVYEKLPVQNAVALMSDGSAFKRFLVGPEDVFQIEGEAILGLKRVKKIFKKHRKVQGKEGISFIPVEIEASKDELL